MFFLNLSKNGVGFDLKLGICGAHEQRYAASNFI